MAIRKPQVFLVQLGDEFQVSLWEDSYTNLRNKLEVHYELVKGTTTAAIVKQLSRSDPHCKAVLVIDGGLSTQNFKKAQIKLSEYAKAGGTVIMCCSFSSFVSGPDFVTLMANMGLAWKWGNYHRANFVLNPAFQSVFGIVTFAGLERSYNMKTAHLKEIPPEAKIYRPTNESRVQPVVGPPKRVATAQCPAVWQKHGEGIVGFIGDVNNEAGSQALLMAMLRTAADGSSSGGTIEGMGGLSLAEGCVVCGKTGSVKKCGGCKGVQYCSVACQKPDWVDHKLDCHKVATPS